MENKTTQQDINRIVWKACDTFRGVIDPSQYKDYVLTMLFLKYVSDVYKSKYNEYLTRYDGDEERARRAMKRERFDIPEESSFDYLCWYLNREDTIGFLKANATGTSIPSISKALIEECVINIPSMCVQKNIVAVNQLQQREQRIYNEVTNLRNKLIQKQLIEKTK